MAAFDSEVSKQRQFARIFDRYFTAFAFIAESRIFIALHWGIHLAPR